MTQQKKHKSKCRIPKFASREAEARFWDTHDFTDYMKEFMPVKVRFAKNLSQGSVVEQTAGRMRNDLPRLAPREERASAEKAIADEAIKRMGG
jgi:CopG antitoxin of type II toxin-antitoxin system